MFAEVKKLSLIVSCNEKVREVFIFLFESISFSPAVKLKIEFYFIQNTTVSTLNTYAKEHQIRKLWLEEGGNHQKSNI